jgi:hypothetical protein
MAVGHDFTREERFAQRAGIPVGELEGSGDGASWLWYHPDKRHMAAVNENGVAWYEQTVDGEGNVSRTRPCRAPRGYRTG